MDLKEFVQKTLTQIAEGVVAAQECAPKGAGVNPRIQGSPQSDENLTSSGTRLQEVEFDVALTTTDSSSLGVGILIAVIGGGGSAEESATSVSRIKFSVPIELPKGKHGDESTI